MDEWLRRLVCCVLKFYGHTLKVSVNLPSDIQPPVFHLKKERFRQERGQPKKLQRAKDRANRK